MDDAVTQRLAALAAQMASGKIKAGVLDRSKARLRDLIGKQRVDRIGQMLVRLLGKDVTAGAFNDFLLTNQGDPDSYYAQVLTVCQRLADTHDGARRMALDPHLGRIAAALTGAEGVRYLPRPGADQAAVRQPDGLAPGQHDLVLPQPPVADASGWPWTTRRSPTAASGTCRARTRPRRCRNVNVAAAHGDLLRLYPRWREIAPAPAVLRAGSAVLHSRPRRRTARART